MFSWLALIGGSGYLAALGTNVWANVARKREALSIVRLLGGSSAMLIAFPVVQALTIALLGFVLATLGYALVALTINARFAAVAAGGAVCTLEPHHLLLAALATHLGRGARCARRRPARRAAATRRRNPPCLEASRSPCSRSRPCRRRRRSRRPGTRSSTTPSPPRAISRCRCPAARA